MLSVKRYIVNRYSSRDSRFTNLKLRFPSVINTADLPAVRVFMATYDGAVLQLQIPFTPRPNLFVPPISGCAIRTALLGNRAAHLWAAEMNRLFVCKQNRCGNIRPKTAQRRACIVEGRAPASLRMKPRRRRAPPSMANGGSQLPYKRLHPKCVGPVCFFQDWSAYTITT